MKNSATYKIACAALCLALCLLLPFLTGQIPEIGGMLSPMHLPVFLCGFVCGGPWGMAVGLIAPLLRSLLFGMPPLFPTALAMAAELLTYGALAGWLYRIFPKKVPYLYLSLILAMIGGRIVWGGAQFGLLGLQGTAFPFSAFLAGAVTNALPGLALQVILIPLIVLALQKADLVADK